MAYRLLALDLDGTTLQDDHQLNPWTKNIVQQIKEKYPVVIATGRHHTAAKPYHDELGLTTPIICCNGVYQFDFAKNIEVNDQPIPHKLASQFIELANQYDLQLVMYTYEGMVFSRSNPITYMLPLRQWAKSYPSNQQPNIYQVDSFEEELTKTSKVWKFVAQGSPQNFGQFLQQPLITDYFTGSLSGENKIDLAMKGHSKGLALTNYLKLNNIDMKQAVVAGDNFNDISMLKAVGCGIAMQHADKDVKKYAKIICPTNHHGDGLQQLLKQYFPLE